LTAVKPALLMILTAQEHLLLHHQSLPNQNLRIR
jgi:hypothetical protein